MRILIVGDSVAQGSAGDWTWRYRLWAALNGAGASVDFVGPRQDLQDNVFDWLCTPDQAAAAALGVVDSSHLPCNEEYADPGFDQDHAARWGMALSAPDDSMTDLVEEFQPDVVVEARGINDLTRGHSATELAGLVMSEIADARAVDPTVDFVVGALPQTWLSDVVGTYNAMLPELAASLSSGDSRVVTAATGEGFDKFADTWDTVHLAASGELKMAAGVADALATLGVGEAYPRPIPVVDNGHWGRGHLTVTARNGAADLNWTRPAGGREEYIWMRDATAGDSWLQLPFPISGTTWTAGGLINGNTYQFRVQALKGLVASSVYSNVAVATPTDVRPSVAAPGAPRSVAAAPVPHGLNVSWGAAPGATSYGVSWVGRKSGRAGSRTVTGTSLGISALLAGEPYVVTITPRNEVGSGPAVRSFGTPTGPIVAGVRALRVVRVGAHGARILWRGWPAATSYVVWQRSGGQWVPSKTTTATSVTVRRIPSGPVAFRVRSWHQQLAGQWSDTVRVR